MASLQDFQDLLEQQFNEYVRLSSQIGDVVKQHAEMALSAVKEQLRLLQLAAQYVKPSDAQIQSLIKPLASKIEAIQAFREKHRASPFFNHLSTISESIPALGWVVVSPTPAPYVKDMSDSGQFYGNKVLVAYKEKDKTHVDWANSWKEFLAALHKFIRQHHTTGLVWNSRGETVNSSVISGGSSAGGPPPPPPPPQAPLLSCSGGDQHTNNSENHLQLMKELNIGTDITKSLRKVRPEEQTHKNPSLRNAPPAATKTSQYVVGNSGNSQQVTKPPKFSLEGRKWLIEYQTNQPQLIVNINEMSESVHLYKCTNTVVILKGKANSIIVDSCVKSGVVFDDIVCSVEFVNCQNVQAQVKIIN